MIGVSKYYDKKPVLKNIYLSYFYGAKIGVLGLNGSGKSSLLRILAGVDKEFNGETALSPGHTVGFLAQEPELDDKKTIREIVEEGVQEIVNSSSGHNALAQLVFAGGALTPPLTRGMLSAPLDPQHMVPRAPARGI